MSRLTKTIFFIGIVLIVYGYLCRVLGIYFFWDSKSFGWIVIFVGLLCYLFDLNKSRNKQGRKTLWIKIGMGFLLFAFVISGVVIFKLRKTQAYQTAIEYLKINSKIINETGDIKSFGLIPTGSVQTTTINGSESGDATFNLTIKGSKKCKDVTISLQKTPQTDWTVTDLE